MNEKCVFYNKEENNCIALKQLECEGCSFYKTKEDLELDEKIAYIRAYKKTHKDACKKCKTNCCFWNSKSNRCNILKASFCMVEEDCGFYKERNITDNDVIHWVEVERSGPNGFRETGVRYGGH